MLCLIRYPTYLDTLKLVLIAMHILIFVIGCMLIYYGANELFLDNILKSYFILFFGNPENIAISVGIFILFLSIIGFCVTSLCKDVSILKMHLLFLVLIVLYQIANCIDIFALSVLPDFMKKNMMYGINFYKFNGTDKFSLAWDTIQEDRQCCGIYGSNDWFECDECIVVNKFPKSCCQHDYNQCQLKNINKTSEDDIPEVFDVGCFSKLVNLIDHHFLYSLEWFSLFILFQILVIILSYVHITQIERRTKMDQQMIVENEIEDDDSDDFFAINENTKMIPRKRIKENF